MKKKKNSKKFAFLILCVLILVIFYALNTRKSSVRPLLTAKDLHVIELYAHFKFPESTRMLKAYWDAGEAEKLYLHFEFDLNEAKKFMESLDWDQEGFEYFDGDFQWRKVTDFNIVKQKVVPFTKKNHDLSWNENEVQELEWWSLGESETNWVFHVWGGEIKDMDIILQQYVLLQEIQETCRVYMYMQWSCLSKDSRQYMKNIRKLFPWDVHWKYRETESIPYPMSYSKIDPSV